MKSDEKDNWRPHCVASSEPSIAIKEGRKQWAKKGQKIGVKSQKLRKINLLLKKSFFHLKLENNWFLFNQFR